MVKIERLPNKWIAAFSLFSSNKTLFTTKKSPKDIYCINGIRSLSLIWIIFGHRYGIYFYTPLINRSDIVVEWLPNYFSGFVNSFHYAVDSFLLLGGFLVSYSLLNEFEENKTFLHVLYKIFRRILRIFPAYAAMILFTVSIAHHMGNGPFYKPFMSSISENCEKNWWAALLFIQNYYNPMQLCLGHTWYLSVDMQLFILSPFLIYPLWRYRQSFLPIIIGLISLQIAYVFIVVYINDFKTWGPSK